MLLIYHHQFFHSSLIQRFIVGAGHLAKAPQMRYKLEDWNDRKILVGQEWKPADERWESNVKNEMGSALHRIGSITDHELKRVRLLGAASASRRFDSNQELLELIEVLKKVYADKHLQYELILPNTKLFLGDREDLLELFGNLLDNASKWGNAAYV